MGRVAAGPFPPDAAGPEPLLRPQDVPMKPRRQAQRIPAQRRGRRRAGPPPGARRMACAALLSCAAMLAACGGGGGSSTAPPEMMPPEMMPPAAQAALTVMAGGSASGGGSVSVAVGSGVAGVVGAGASSSVAAAGDTVTLTATAADGWAFAGWTLSGGLACAGGPAGNPCTLAAGSLGADATAEAAFALVATTLTVSAGPNGSVSAEVDGADAVTVAAGESTDVAVSVLSSATTLTAVASAGHAFTGWALSGGNGSLACAEGAPSSNPCTLALGSLSADATATATFEAVQRTLTVTAGPNGSVDVEVDGADAVTVAAGESTDVAVRRRGDADGHRVRRIRLHRLGAVGRAARWPAPRAPPPPTPARWRSVRSAPTRRPRPSSRTSSPWRCPPAPAARWP